MGCALGSDAAEMYECPAERRCDAHRLARRWQLCKELSLLFLHPAFTALLAIASTKNTDSVGIRDLKNMKFIALIRKLEHWDKNLENIIKIWF
jgi:hypothetical protein